MFTTKGDHHATEQLDGWQVVHHHHGRADVMDHQEIWAARAPAIR